MASMQNTELLVPYAAPAGMYTISVLLPVLGICLVGLRIYTRVLQKNAFGIDDWLMLPALVCVIGMGITLIIGVNGGAVAYPTPFDPNSTPEEELTVINPTIELMGKIQYGFLLLSILASGFTKLSITYFYRRLFLTRKGLPFDWATRISIAVVVLWCTSFFFGFMFDCGTDISANWGSVQDQASCTAALDLDNALVISDLVTDILVLCLPLPVIWNLHMTVGRKLTVIGILATGAISIVAAIVKVMISFEITNAGFTTNVDPDLTVSTILLWTMIEAGLAIIAACLPTLRFLVGKVSLDSMMNSVRSAFSLGSIRSQRSQISAARDGGPYSDLNGNGSRAQIVSNGGQTEISDLGSLETARAVGENIQVTQEISQYHSAV